MPYRAAIFDLDGTLLDSLSLWEQVGGLYLTGLGLPIPSGLPNTVQEMTLTESARYFHDVLGVPLSPDEIVSGLLEVPARAYRETLPLKPGAAELLHALSAHGVPLALATLSDRGLAEAALCRLDVLSLFSVLVTAGELGAGKDTPCLYLTAARQLGIPPAKTLVLEDSPSAIRTAKAAGFPVAAVYDPKHAADWPALCTLCDHALFQFGPQESQSLLNRF